MKLIFLLLILIIFSSTILAQGNNSNNFSWVRNVTCVARPNQDDSALLGAISWACSNGIDCTPIQPGGGAFWPNTTEAHASWVFNEYYQTSGQQIHMSTCDFGGLAMLQCAQNSGKGLKKERIIGVNLGSWFELEPWIVPSMFTQFEGKPSAQVAIDEYTFNQVLGQTEATKQLTKHWETWFTEADFQQIKAAGFTHVRLPFGDHAFGESPQMVGNIKYIDQAILWAEQYDLKVLLDLHGVPMSSSTDGLGTNASSQNGFDNSLVATAGVNGRSCPPAKPDCPPNHWWGNHAERPLAINRTLAFWQKIILRYQNSPAIWGVELINEPREIPMTVLREYYERGYDLIRGLIGDKWVVVIHDGFYPHGWWDFMTPAKGFTRVMLDTHAYEAFGPDMPDENHLDEACGYTENVDYQQCNELPTIVGEWSNAVNDCARWLLGFSVPPVSEMCNQTPPNVPYNNSFFTEFSRRQISAWYRSEGFFFWTWKTENSAQGGSDDQVWSAQLSIQNGWLPNFNGGISDDIINLCNYSFV